MYTKIFNPDPKPITLKDKDKDGKDMIVTIPAKGFAIFSEKVASMLQRLYAGLEHTSATDKEYKDYRLEKSKIDKADAKANLAKQAQDALEAKQQAKAEAEAYQQKLDAAEAEVKVKADAHIRAVKDEKVLLTNMAKTQVNRYDTHEVRAADAEDKLLKKAAREASQKGKK